MFGERRLSLQSDDLPAQAAQHRGLITRARAHLESDVVGLRLKSLRHQRDHQRLRDRLSAFDGERAILVRVAPLPRREERIARNLGHRAQHALIGHAVRHQLLGDHPLGRCAHRG